MGRTRPLVEELVRIPSVNPDLAPGASGEADLAVYVRQWLDDHGVEAWIDEAAPGRPNVVGSVGTGRGPTLVLCAHLDTVGIDGMEIEPFEPVVDAADGRLYGRGAYDMKGAVAACMVAAAEVAGQSKSELEGRLLLALVCDEESASLGAFDFVERYEADGCILTEPSEGGLIVAHKGFAWIEVEIPGRAAHGSRWEEGRSAVHAAAPVVAALEELDRKVLRGRTHPLCGPASLHCARIDGGSGWSTYAGRCVIQVERRTLPGESPEDVAGELEAVIVEAAPDAEVRVVVERPPLEGTESGPLVDAVEGAVRAVTGHTPPHRGAAYWMDAAVFAARGIPVVNYGPSGEGAHAAVEWVDLASVERCKDVLIEATRRFFRTGAGPVP